MSGTITVKGRSKLEYETEEAVFVFDILTEGNTPDEASAQNKTKTDGVLSVLKNAIGSDSVKIKGFTVRPAYQKIKVLDAKEFVAKNKIEIRCSEISLIGKLFNTLPQLGVSNIDGPFYELKDIEAKKDEARQKAIAEANRIAKLYARCGLAFETGDVIEIVENYVKVYPYDDLDYSCPVEASTLSGIGPSPVPSFEQTVVISAEVELKLSLETYTAI